MNKIIISFTILVSIFTCGCADLPEQAATDKQTAFYETTELFPRTKDHTHGSTIVELSNGDLLTAWFQGSGERWADDVVIMGARLKHGASAWSKPFLMADTPGFPDVNPVLFIDGADRLWLVWYPVIANLWESSLPKYRISEDYLGTGAPVWNWQDIILVKPGSSTERGIQPNDKFVATVERQLKAYEAKNKSLIDTNPEAKEMWDWWRSDRLSKAKGEDMMYNGYLYDSVGNRTSQKMGFPLMRRIGWQTKNKAVITDKGRIVLPLYSDNFGFSIMAITDDGGKNWQFSDPLVGIENIQPAIAFRKNGDMVSFMRDNGPPPYRLQVSSSSDDGKTWSDVEDTDIPNPGAGSDIVTLSNGHWVLANNDTEDGRHSLAIAISTNEGATWDYIRHLELDVRDKEVASTGAYPSVIQGHDDRIHVVYSFTSREKESPKGETIKYAVFNEAWVMKGDQP